MTVQELLAEHDRLCSTGRAIMTRKNADYANPEDSGDPFANFRICEAVGLTTAEVGIMVRLTDKFSRLSTLLKKDPQVVEESFEDTVIDSINYLILLNSLRKK